MASVTSRLLSNILRCKRLALVAAEDCDFFARTLDEIFLSLEVDGLTTVNMREVASQPEPEPERFRVALSFSNPNHDHGGTSSNAFFALPISLG